MRRAKDIGAIHGPEHIQRWYDHCTRARERERDMSTQPTMNKQTHSTKTMSRTYGYGWRPQAKGDIHGLTDGSWFHQVTLATIRSILPQGSPSGQFSPAGRVPFWQCWIQHFVMFCAPFKSRSLCSPHVGHCTCLSANITFGEPQQLLFFDVLYSLMRTTRRHRANFRRSERHGAVPLSPVAHLRP